MNKYYNVLKKAAMFGKKDKKKNAPSQDDTKNDQHRKKKFKDKIVSGFNAIIELAEVIFDDLPDFDD